MKIVILCGGKGTRSYPYTEYLPKAMMPISGKPIIVHLMEIYAQQGFTDFVLAAGYRQEILLDYFEGRFKQWNIQIADTGQESDTGERIRRCESYVGDTFFATYGDGLGNIDLHELLYFHKESKALATITAVPLRSQYGRVLFDDKKKIYQFQEKPVISGFWINAGFFVFEKSVFDYWEGQNLECNVLPKLAELDLLYSYVHSDFWKSMDTSKDQEEMERIYTHETLLNGKAPWFLKIEDKIIQVSEQPVIRQNGDPGKHPRMENLG